MLICKVCGRQFLVINAAHLKRHGMTVAEYKEKFNSPCFDISIGKKISKKNKGVINIGDKNPAKRKEVRAKISKSVSEKWEEGAYDSRINGMLGRFGELSPQWKEELHTPLALSEKNYREFLSKYQDISKCSNCGKEEGAINIHHIDEEHSNFLPSNLEPLCVFCHSQYHYTRRRRPFVSIGKIMSFASAHRLPFYDGKCSNWHGHEWKIEVTLRKRVSAKTGMVMDFSEMKKVIQRHVIEPLDHDVLNRYLVNPTAENILVWCWEQLMFDGLLKGIQSISIWESSDSKASLDIQGMLSIFSENIEEYLVRKKEVSINKRSSE